MLQQIIDGKPMIVGLTWHHQLPEKMQLVNSEIHQANHLGGNAVWVRRNQIINNYVEWKYEDEKISINEIMEVESVWGIKLPKDCVECAI